MINLSEYLELDSVDGRRWLVGACLGLLIVGGVWWGVRSRILSAEETAASSRSVAESAQKIAEQAERSAGERAAIVAELRELQRVISELAKETPTRDELANVQRSVQDTARSFAAVVSYLPTKLDSVDRGLEEISRELRVHAALGADADAFERGRQEIMMRSLELLLREHGRPMPEQEDGE